MSVTQRNSRSAEPLARARMSAADRREAILEAARAAFAEGGFHETSLDAVAERAGVSKALLYEHFSSKRELYVAMLEMHVHELVERISGAVAGAEPGEPRMRAGLEAFFGFVEERRGAWRIMFRNSDDPDVSIRLDRLRDEVAAAIVTLMSEEAAAKGIRFPNMPQTVEMLAQQIVGAMQSLADWWDLHREVPRAEVLRVAMDFAWVGQERLSRGERWDVG
ncbi:MAG TPA: helix-turn-helix domain-containing protein [Solirubrobacterales bacterium]|nr:helix-turn-helix domain-containing protein [Solirubrobacterales bacterium]